MRDYRRLLYENLDFFLNLLCVISALYFFSSKPEIMAAIIVGGVSLAIGVRTNRVARDKLFKEIFMEYNNKYDLRFNNALGRIVCEAESDENYAVNKEDKELVIDYINFCSEEYLWYTKGGIPKRVWDAWYNGIKFYLKNKTINKVFRLELENNRASYYGFMEYIISDLQNEK